MGWRGWDLVGEPQPSPEHHPLWLSKAILELPSKHLLLLPLPPYTQAFGNSIPGSTSSHRLPHRPSAAHFGPEQPGPSPVTLGATSTLLPHSDVTCWCHLLFQSRRAGTNPCVLRSPQSSEHRPGY